MSTETASACAACAVCGARLTPELVVAVGLPFCRGCLTPGDRGGPAPGYEGTFPPIWWGAAIGGVFLAVLLAGALLGYLTQLTLGALGVRLPLGWLGVSAGALAFATRLARVQAVLDRRWKRVLAANLGLAKLPLERLALAVLLKRRDAPSAEDLVLLAEAEDALVFIGARDGLSVLPLSQISSPPEPDGFMSAWWARLELADHTTRWIQVREGGDGAWGRQVATGGFACRVFARRRLTYWQEAVSGRSGALAGLRIRDLPERLGDGDALEPGVSATWEASAPAGACRPLVFAALWLLLLDRGWRPAPEPWDWPLAKDGRHLDLAGMFERLADGELSPQAWRETWEREGVADVDLGGFAAALHASSERS